MFGDSCVQVSSPSITPSGDSLFFERGYQIYVARKSGESWTNPELFTSLASSTLCRNPSLSRDGSKLYFSHYNLNGWDLFVCALNAADGTWGLPISLGDSINSSFNEEMYCFDPSNGSLFVQRDSGASMFELSVWDSTLNRWGPFQDIVITPETRRVCVPPYLAGLMSGFSFTSDMLKLYIGIEVYVGVGHTKPDYQIFECAYDSVSRQYCNPIEININTVSGTSEAKGREEHPWISADGRKLFFDSNRDTTCIWSALYQCDLVGDEVKQHAPFLPSSGGLDVYPNPAKSEAVVRIIDSSFSGDHDVRTVTLTDVLGRRIKMLRGITVGIVTQIDVSMEDLCSGIYVLSYAAGGRMGQKEFVVRR